MPRRRRARATLKGSITEHPAWPVLRPYVIIEPYNRDTSRIKTRHRIEVQPPPQGHILREILAIAMPCVICEQTIHPVRPRAGRRGRLYYAPTCPLDKTRTCSRQPVVGEEYTRVRQDVEAWQRAQGIARAPKRQRAEQPPLPL